MKKAMTVALVLALMGGLSACNTMQGLGQDIKSAGNSLENTAERHK